jgi:hypothetical protein
VFSDAISLLLEVIERSPALSGANDLSSDELVGDLNGSLELRNGVFWRTEVRHEVVALVLVIDLESEPAVTPPIDPGYLTTIVGDNVREALDGLLKVALFEASIQDDQSFVLPHIASFGHGAESLSGPKAPSPHDRMVRISE